jgi:hypothetical protein
MADVRSAKQVEASTAVQRKPSREALPEIEWLAVADLLVDYSYQHRPYASAIDALNKDFLDVLPRLKSRDSQDRSLTPEAESDAY